MSDFAKLMPFKPRLVMLKHLTRHLQSALQAQKQNAIVLTASYPLKLELLAAQQRTARPASVQSLQPLTLPARAGALARCEAAAFEGAEPETCYDLPELHFEILKAQAGEPEMCRVPASRFTTFAYGNPSKQLLEFLATLIDTALQEYGFSCQRQQQRVCFRALQSDTQLLLRQLAFAPEACKPCSAGLSAGLASMPEGESYPAPLFLWWGPYQINSQRCEVCLPAAPVSTFSSRFLAELSDQLAPTGIQARWTSEQYLELLQTSPTEELRISAFDRPELNPPHRYLDLPLATGQYQGQGPPAELGALKVNAQLYPLPAPAGTFASLDALRGALLHLLNQTLNAAHLTVSLTGDVLCFYWTGPLTESLVIQASPGFLQEILGFQELHYQCPDTGVLQESLHSWHKLAWRLYQDLILQTEAESLCSAVILPSVLGDLAHVDTLRVKVWLHFPEVAGGYLTAVLQAIEELLLRLPESQKTRQRPEPLSHIPLLHLPQTYPAGPPAGPAEPPENPPPTFDHQI